MLISKHLLNFAVFNSLMDVGLVVLIKLAFLILVLNIDRAAIRVVPILDLIVNLRILVPEIKR